MSLDVEALINELTVEEKISLLAGLDFWHTVPVERLNIPSIRVSDGPNGIRGTKFFDAVGSNCFPCGTAMAASFDKDLLYESGKMMGTEARAKGAHCILGPTCNIVRSPLGGRAFESYSEDPVLSGYAAGQIIQGIQSQKILACIKHYVANDQEDERKLVDALITERALREIYLKPFQIAIRDSNPRSLMTAYNKVNGEHVSQSKKFLQDILRKEYNWDGLIMSDWFGVYSTKESLEAGLNLEMPGPTRFRMDTPTAHKVYASEIHRDVIDENARYVLNFVNESLASGVPPNAPEESNTTPEAAALLRKVGGNSLVLLKNDGTLPLPKTGLKKVAVIGPSAKVGRLSGGGSASLKPAYVVTPFDAISEKLKDSGAEVTFTEGATLERILPDVANLLRTEDGSVGFTGHFYDQPPSVKDRKVLESRKLNGSHIFLSDIVSTVLKPGQRLFYTDFKGSYKHEGPTQVFDVGCSTLGSAQIFINGELVVDNKTKQVRGNDFFLGMGTREERSSYTFEQGKTYDILVEYGSGPTGTIGQESSEIGGVYFGFAPQVNAEEEISKAVSLAKEADVVILVVGINKEWESEGFDRPDMHIPGATNELIAKVAEVNKKVVVVNHSGSPVSMPWVDQVGSLVQAWYGGNQVGNAVADVLFGDVNPSAKLPMTFPKKIEDTPAFLNFASEKGRALYGEDVFVGYRYYEKVGRDVLFPFGFGLSYTSFKFSDLKVSTDGKVVKASVSVKNTGKVDGSEAVQLYVSQEETTLIRPKRELKAFEKVHLKSGEEKTVHLEVSVREAASYWNEYYDKWVVEKGTYNVQVTNGSEESLVGSFEVDKEEKWRGL